MLPKRNRLNKSAVRDALREGKSVRTRTFLVKVYPSPTFKAAVVVSKKIDKSAVKRNTIRRKVYGVLDRLQLDDVTNSYVINVISPVIPEERDLITELSSFIRS